MFFLAATFVHFGEEYVNDWPQSCPNLSSQRWWFRQKKKTWIEKTANKNIVTMGLISFSLFFGGMNILKKCSKPHPPSGRFAQHTKDMKCMCPLAAPSRTKTIQKMGPIKKAWKENLSHLPSDSCTNPNARFTLPEAWNNTHNSNEHRPRPKMKASSSNH